MRREAAAISPITEIIAEIRAGRIVVLIDDEDRENEGDLVFAAEFVTAEKINFLAKHGRGLICMPITEAHAARLGLQPMVQHNRSRHGTNFTNSIEAAEGIATGISAHDRALTVKVACSATSTAALKPSIARPTWWMAWTRSIGKRWIGFEGLRRCCAGCDSPRPTHPNDD